MPKAKVSITTRIREERPDRKESSDDFESVTVELFGEDIRLLKGAINIFGMIEAFDPDNPSNATKFLTRLVHEEDQRAFKNAIASQREFTGKDFETLLEEMMKAVGDGNPSVRSNASGGSKPSTRRTTARALSAAK